MAFTGGNGPALNAYLLTSIFDGNVVACVGDASAVPAEQLAHAQYVAELLGNALLSMLFRISCYMSVLLTELNVCRLPIFGCLGTEE